MCIFLIFFLHTQLPAGDEGESTKSKEVEEVKSWSRSSAQLNTLLRWIDYKTFLLITGATRENNRGFVKII